MNSPRLIVLSSFLFWLVVYLERGQLIPLSHAAPPILIRKKKDMHKLQKTHKRRSLNLVHLRMEKSPKAVRQATVFTHKT